MKRIRFSNGPLLVSAVLLAVAGGIEEVQAAPVFQPGWPRAITYGSVPGTPFLADFDPSVPGLEVICLADFSSVCCDTTGVMVWHQDGSAMPGWNPRILPGERPNIASEPSSADLDRDGIPEMIFSTSHRLHALRWNGTEAAGWPQTLSATGGDTPVVADLDRDGRLEVLLTTRDGYIHIWRDTGTAFRPDVWPRQLTCMIGWTWPPAVGNLDADPEFEIVAGASMIYAFNPDGSDVAGAWPVALTGIDQAIGSPVIGDLDGDGSAEVVIGSGFGIANPSWIHVLRADGTPMSGWPFEVEAYPSHFALADLDPDFPGLEILVAPKCGNRSWAFHLDSSSVPGWPFQADPGEQMGDAVLVGDFDPSEGLEVCTSGYAGLYVMGDHGAPWPDLPYGDGWVCQFSPAMADIDGDGVIEVALSSARRLSVWKLGRGASGEAAALPWPMKQHDIGHTGWVQSTEASGIFAGSRSGLPRLVARCVPNPAVAGTWIDFTLAAPSEVRLRIVDPAGSLVRSLSWDRLPAGTSRLKWDGRDQSGNRAPAGPYFYQVGAGDQRTGGRVILIH